ncbi:MAG: hypothetical protein NDI69_16855 [Bacteriovoracaceae bacterium]|nr:hypothetical protein [Bacteriovoracaceae bacterium]
MKAWRLVALLSLFSGHVFAQEQLALRLNEQGMMKILRMAVQYNTATKESRTIVIPQNIYKFTIPKSQILSNPIIPVVNEISDLNLNKDLNFYLNTSDIKVTGDVDQKSLKMTILNSTDNGFDLRLSLDLPQISMDGSRLSLCEDKDRYSKNCGNGLKASLSQLNIKTTGKPVTVTAVLSLRTDGQVARVKVKSVETNLESRSAPGLDINFKSVDVPRIAIVINGQETELDTSRLKNEILKYKTFLSKKLISFVADFIAGDLVEMLNVYLVNAEVATSYQVYRKDMPVKFDEFLSFPRPAPAGYLRSAISEIEKRNNPISTMLAQISEVIRSAQVDIALKKISTPENKDVELAGLVNLVLNGRGLNVRNTLGNSFRILPKLDLTAHRNNDINLAISEPVINGALDLVNSTGLFQEVLEAAAKVPGVSINNVKMHFNGDKSVVAVVNAQVDLKKLESNSIASWFKNNIAAFLERNNNNSVIYFPIEVEVIPFFKKLANGGTGIDLKVLSPFNYAELPNRFNYPTNVPKMSEIVKAGVMDELRGSLEPHTNKTYSVDLSKFLNQAGVEFLPKSISINQSSYLLLNMDVVDIKFNSKNPNLR